MNPVAFHLTDVLIHLVATLALYALASVLGLRAWAAAIGAATFALHPVMASVVPNLPRRHDSLAAAGVFVALALTAWVVKQPRLSPAATLATVLAALALGFAELSKEVGYLGLVLAAPTAFAAAISAGGRLRDYLGRIAVLLFALSLITALLIAWRWLVLGGLGGYYDRTPPFANLDVALNDLLENLLFPFFGLLGRTPRAWLTEIGLAAVISGAAALLGGRRTRTVIVYGWLWLVVCALFQVLTKSLAAWHTYLTVAGFAFLAGGVLDAALDVWRSPAKPWPSKAVLTASVAGVLWFEVALLQSSVIMRPFDEWRIAGEVARSYLLSLRPCLESTPPGVPIVVGNAPEQLEVTTPERRLIHAGILGPYSVEPAVHLVMPDLSHRRLTARNLVELSAQPTSMTTRCRIEDGIWIITTDFTM